MNKERLALFLFILMRDHVPFGVVPDIIENHVNKLKAEPASVADAEETLALLNIAHGYATRLLG